MGFYKMGMLSPSLRQDINEDGPLGPFFVSAFRTLRRDTHPPLYGGVGGAGDRRAGRVRVLHRVDVSILRAIDGVCEAALVRDRADQLVVFGVPAGLVATIVVSLLDRAPDSYTKALVD
jgi:hypothetical protein